MRAQDRPRQRIRYHVLSPMIHTWRAAAQLSPKTFDYRYGFGTALNDVGHHAEAIPELRACTDLDPQSAKAWAALGLALQRTGDNAAALGASTRGDEGSFQG